VRADTKAKILICMLVLSFFISIVFADIITNTESEFNKGIYSNTYYNTTNNALQLSSTIGNYTSEIFDANRTATWNITYESETPISQEIFVIDGQKSVFTSTNGSIWNTKTEDYSGTNKLDGLVINSNNELILVDNKDIYLSSDFGINWTKINDDFTPYSNKAIKMTIDNNDNLYIIDGAERVFKSTNNGNNWTEINSDFSSRTTSNAKGFAVNSNNILFAVDGSGDVYSSSNEGINWTYLSDYGGGSSTDSLAIDQNDYLYILLDKDVYQSTNSGLNWTKINDAFTPYSNNGLLLFFDKIDSLIIIDAVGRVFKSTNQGINWTELGDCNGDATNDPKTGTIAVYNSNITLSARSCDDNFCSGESFSTNLNVSNNQYYQYNFEFEADNLEYSPKLYNTTIKYEQLPIINYNITFTIQNNSKNAYGHLNGTLNNTRYDNGIKIELSQTQGEYYSPIINAHQTAEWNKITIQKSTKQIQPSNEQGLILLMHLDETNGTITDTSGQNNNGAYNGNLYSQTGKINKSIGFNGNEKIQIERTNNPELDPANEITLSAWVKNTNRNNNWQKKVICRAGGSSGCSYGLYFNDGSSYDRLGVEIRTETGNHKKEWDWTEMNTEWFHWAMTFSSGTMKLYLNGQEKASWTGLGNTITHRNQYSNDDLFIGASDTGSNIYANIDEAAIWNRTLSADEIADLYERTRQTINISARSCDDSNCNGENWTSIEQELTLTNNQYFQYKTELTTQNSNFTPTFYNATIEYTLITETDTTPPSVLNITPLAGTNFSKNSIVQITANVTDNTAVDKVYANITKPDLSITWLELQDDDLDEIYNNSITANQEGWYYITIIANDTSGNINNTEKTNFDPASLGGGGGGGGGGVASKSYQSLADWKKPNLDAQIIRPTECAESWICDSWKECVNGKQTRNCEDYYNCGTEKTKPDETRKCDEKPKEINKITGQTTEEQEKRYALTITPPNPKYRAILSAGIATVLSIVLLGVMISRKTQKTKQQEQETHQKIQKKKQTLITKLKKAYQIRK